jgi:hypothetical protein
MSGPVQTSYSFAPAQGLPGMRAGYRPGAFALTMIAFAALTPGRIYFKGPASGNAAGEVGPIEPAADVDAIIATGASSGSQQVISGVSLDGVIGAAEIYPPRNITLTFSSHANWDATTAVVAGTDENGVAQTENFTIPDGGNATVTGATKFRTVTSITIPAQSGTSGTFTAGVGSLLGAADHFVAGIVERDVTRTSETYADGELVPIGREGEYFVTSETAVKDGDPVWVRVVAGAGEYLGAVRATPDSNDCVRLKGARFTSTNSAGLSKLTLNLPAG